MDQKPGTLVNLKIAGSESSPNLAIEIAIRWVPTI